MSATRNSKSLAERIDISYWSRSHPLRRWKWLLAGLAVALAVVWLVLAAVLGNQRLYEAGPLSTVHAMLESDCGQCHTQSWQPAVRLVSLDSHRRSVPDSACTRCHDGPIHHDGQIAADVPNCAGCHREHRGEAALARVQDAECVACHAELKTVSGSTSFEKHVTRFASGGGGAPGHPEFAVLRRKDADTAAIKFNHAVHLKPEGVPVNADKESKENQLELLNCSNCHQPDAERRYMRPIDHEKHCNRCHKNSLAFDANRFSGSPAPHRDPDIVRAVIRQRYTEFVLQNPAVTGEGERPAAERRIPGRAAARQMTKAQCDWVNKQIEPAERVLFDGAGGCKYCHQVSTENGWQITKPIIPARWLTHSQFRHDSHRLLGCSECHAAEASSQTSDVLMPSIESCRKCHGPSGRARSDCVECHSYHDKSRERDFNGPLSVGLKELSGERAPQAKPN